MIDEQIINFCIDYSQFEIKDHIIKRNLEISKNSN